LSIPNHRTYSETVFISQENLNTTAHENSDFIPQSKTLLNI